MFRQMAHALKGGKSRLAESARVRFLSSGLFLHNHHLRPGHSMNGVRRLLGGTTGASPPSPDKESPPVQNTPTAPLSFIKNNQANWPPQSPTAPHKQPTLSESFQTTAALFLSKKDKTRQQPEDEEALGSPYSATRQLNGSSSHTKSSSHSRNNQHSPSPSRSATLSGSVSGPSSPVLQNRGVSRKSVNKLDPDVKRSSGFINTRDELLMSLLASEAVVDCREFAVLTLEEVEDLKKVRATWRLSMLCHSVKYRNNKFSMRAS